MAAQPNMHNPRTIHGVPETHHPRCANSAGRPAPLRNFNHGTHGRHGKKNAENSKKTKDPSLSPQQHGVINGRGDVDEGHQEERQAERDVHGVPQREQAAG